TRNSISRTRPPLAPPVDRVGTPALSPCTSRPKTPATPSDSGRAGSHHGAGSSSTPLYGSPSFSHTPASSPHGAHDYAAIPQSCTRPAAAFARHDSTTSTPPVASDSGRIHGSCHRSARARARSTRLSIWVGQIVLEFTVTGTGRSELAPRPPVSPRTSASPAS